MSSSISVPAPTTNPRRRYVQAVLLVLLGGALFALDLLAVATKTGLAAWDVPVHDWFVSHRSSSVTWLWESITTLSSPTYLTILGLVFAALWAVVRRELWRPGLLLGAMAFAVAVSYVIKHAVARPRPPASGFMMGPDDAFSFPSGHTLGAAVFIFTLGYLLLSRHSPPWHRVGAVAAAVVLVPAVAASRLYLGYHWLTDVSGSVALAIAILGLVIAVDTWQPLQGWSSAARRRRGSPAPAP